MIENAEQYEVVMAELSALISDDPEPESEKGVRLLALFDEAHAYERATLPPEWFSEKK